MEKSSLTEWVIAIKGFFHFDPFGGFEMI